MKIPASLMLALMQVQVSARLAYGGSQPTQKICYVCGEKHFQRTKYCKRKECERAYKKR